MKLRIALEEKEMDVRLRDRFVAEGKTTAKDVDAYLQGLPDEEGNFEKVSEATTNTSEETQA
jgi:hypothetical protein